MTSGKKGKKGVKLADTLLAQLRDSRQAASLYLVNGFQMKGEVVEFDEESVLFRHKGIHQLVMRSAVASMYPISKSSQGDDGWWRALAPTEMAQKADSRE